MLGVALYLSELFRFYSLSFASFPINSYLQCHEGHSFIQAEYSNYWRLKPCFYFVWDKSGLTNKLVSC